MTGNTNLEHLAERGSPVGADQMIARLEADLLGGSKPVVGRDRAASPAGSRADRRALVSIVAGLAVVLVLGGGWWLLSPAEGGPSGPVAQEPDAVAPDALAAELAASPLPGGPMQWPSFSMSATLGVHTDNEPGLEGIGLRWAGPEAWWWERCTIDAVSRSETCPVTYQIDGSRYEAQFSGEGTLSGEAEAGLPLNWFGESVPPALAWVLARPNADLRPELAEPEHPLAAVAAVAEVDGIGFRMEFTAEGIPVVKETDPPQESDFWLTHLESREVSDTEIRTGRPPGFEVDTGQRTNPEVVRTLGVDGITIEIVISEDCIDFDVFSASGARAGSTGGCGYLPAEGLTVLGSGGVSVDGRGVNLIEGMADPEIATVRAIFSDGTVLSDQPQDGLWLVVWIEEGPLTEEIPDVVFEALDEAGNVVATTTFPQPPEPTIDTLHPEVETG